MTDSLSCVLFLKEGGICGDDDTWDFDSLKSDDSFVASLNWDDIWERQDHEAISNWQIGKTDEPWSTRKHSKCVMFRRLKLQP